MFGKSDPYVCIQNFNSNVIIGPTKSKKEGSDTIMKGRVVDNDLNPEFEENFYFPISSRVNRCKVIVKDDELCGEGDLDALIGSLPESPRFIVLDFEFETSDGRPADKVVFVSWCVLHCRFRDVCRRAKSMCLVCFCCFPFPSFFIILGVCVAFR